MANEAELQEQRIKHLEMIQGVISRLANHSFLVKGWAVTVAAVFFGFAVDSDNATLVGASVAPTLAFWGLDTCFLRSERLFRALFDRVRVVPTDVEPFFMGATGDAFVRSLRAGSGKAPFSWWSTVGRPTLVLLYGGLLASAGVIALAVCR